MSVSLKRPKFITCNMTYHSVACFKDFSGTAFRQVPCIEHLNLKYKKKKKKKMGYRTLAKMYKLYTSKISGSLKPLNVFTLYIARSFCHLQWLFEVIHKKLT